MQENEKDFFAMLAERDHTTVEKGQRENLKADMGGPA